MRLLVGDDADCLVAAARLADDRDIAAELGAHTAPDETMVVDQHDADRLAGHAVDTFRARVSATSVPVSPLRTVAVPPWRAIRPTIESRIPRRSAGTASRSKPWPRSRTNTSTPEPPTSANTDTVAAPDDFAALTIASRAAATVAVTASSIGVSPTTTTSMEMPWLSSM